MSPAVVIRSTLAPFDCTSRNGVRTMDADPSILCDPGTAPYGNMRRVAGLMLFLYAVGIPSVFGVVLFRHRRAILFDQTLRQKGQVCAWFACLL